MPDYQSKVPLILEEILRQNKATSGELCCKLRELITASGGGVQYNSIQHYSILSAQTHTFSSNTLHAVSISVVLGTANISLDGGTTYITYPLGSNIRFEGTTLISQQINIQVPGSLGDGINQLIMQTITP